MRERALYLLGLDGGLAAVSSVVVAEGPVVHRVTVVVPHERLQHHGNKRPESPVMMGSSADITAFPTDRFFTFCFIFVFMVTDAGGGDFLLLF